MTWQTFTALTIASAGALTAHAQGTLDASSLGDMDTIKSVSQEVTTLQQRLELIGVMASLERSEESPRETASRLMRVAFADAKDLDEVRTRANALVETHQRELEDLEVTLSLNDAIKAFRTDVSNMVTARIYAKENPEHAPTIMKGIETRARVAITRWRSAREAAEPAMRRVEQALGIRDTKTDDLGIPAIDNEQQSKP